MSNGLKIIFAGTPDFSVAALDALINSSHQVVAVYTQPDRPAGRGRQLTGSPVKQCALHHNLPVEQPQSLKEQDTQATLRAYAADLMVVVAYGLILPETVLQTPPLGCINIHASLLPRWRGAAPIQRAILAGDAETGVTIMQMDKGLDTGAMLHGVKTPISPSDTGSTLHERLAVLGAEALLETLVRIQTGSVQPVAQQDEFSTYADKLNKAEAQLDWQRSALELDRQVRAFNPWPVAETQWQGKRLRVWRAHVLEGESAKGSSGQHTGQATALEPGSVIAIQREGLDVMTADGVLRLTQLQLPGKKALPVQDLINSCEFTDQHFGQSSVLTGPG
ncbi:MAG TPA: methionyl-tRNA formyltransferase [Gammaproteobacteria bacterium]|nr:methionyl-tRNA formyltransferase [Gammaproteobacteria bacterium]